MEERRSFESEVSEGLQVCAGAPTVRHDRLEGARRSVAEDEEDEEARREELTAIDR